MARREIRTPNRQIRSRFLTVQRVALSAVLVGHVRAWSSQCALVGPRGAGGMTNRMTGAAYLQVSLEA
jgi:hypothetical protein